MGYIPIVPKGTTYVDESEKMGLETRNGVIQARFLINEVVCWEAGKLVCPGLLLEFQRIAVNQIYRCAGHFRDGPVSVVSDQGEVVHTPPAHDLVPLLVQEMCDYINENWTAKPPIHLSAYAMWRLNWIHPFFGGNGRTARAFSYLVLCVGLEFPPPTKHKTIPQLIEENREPYNAALRAADTAWRQDKLDLSKMESLLSDLLAIQLVFLHETATGVQHLAQPSTPRTQH